jgi:ABC-type dipeptide/oligopeptide/nickel transport system permease subunit
MASLEQSESGLVVTQERRAEKFFRPIRVFSKQSPVGAVAGVFLVFIALMAVLAPIVAPYHPLTADFTAMTEPPAGAHPLGTDPLGRDTLSRIIFGARYTLMVAFSAVLLGTTLGAVLGVASAYMGGKFDLGVQRVMEVLQAFPDLILALLLMVALGPGLGTVILAIAVTRIPFGGRVVRAVALQVREMDYVTAARAVGVSSVRIMRLHVAPQCIAPYLVLATAHLGVAIIIEASLGFLGVGIPPPTPTWGNMLAMQGNNLIPPWWLVVYPGVAITLIVLAFSLFGDGLRDYLDPRLRGRI